jgi:ATP-dependent protease HslVU (ClpYQ) peptidase subunit
MTTIIGIQGDGFATICTDSRISSFGDEGIAYQVTTLSQSSSKIATNGSYLLGAAGDVRAINILHHAFVPPPPLPGLFGKKLDHFITVKFIPALRECFEKQGYAAPERENSSHIAEHGSTVLVAVNGIIYVIDGDYSWTSDVNGIYSLGTGSSYALGALSILLGTKERTQKTCKDAAMKALKVASTYDPYTGSPFHTFFQQKDTK